MLGQPNLLITLLSFATMRSVAARSWVDIVDTSIYQEILADPYQALFEETTPLNGTEEIVNSETATVSSNDVTPTTDSPSRAPSSFSDKIDMLGTCSDNEVLHTIRMMDLWGDGWDGTAMKITVKTAAKVNSTAGNKSNSTNVSNNTTNGADPESRQLQLKDLYLNLIDKSDAAIPAGITVNHVNVVPFTDDASIAKASISGYLGSVRVPKVVYNGTLKDGSVGNSSICLQIGTCYNVSVFGGLWTEEIKWDIRQLDIGASIDELSPVFLPIAKGMAPISCQFSPKDPLTGQHACPFLCEGDNVKDEVFVSEGATKLPGVSSNVPTTSGTSVPTSPNTSSGIVDDKNTGGNMFWQISGNAGEGNGTTPITDSTRAPTPSIFPSTSGWPTLTPFPSNDSVDVGESLLTNIAVLSNGSPTASGRTPAAGPQAGIVAPSTAHSPAVVPVIGSTPSSTTGIPVAAPVTASVASSPSSSSVAAPVAASVASPTSTSTSPVAAPAIGNASSTSSSSPVAAPVVNSVVQPTFVTPVAGSPVAGSLVAGSPVAGSPVAGSPVAGSPVAGSPVAGSPVAGSPVAGSPVAGSPVSAPVLDMPITSTAPSPSLFPTATAWPTVTGAPTVTGSPVTGPIGPTPQFSAVGAQAAEPTAGTNTQPTTGTNTQPTTGTSAPSNAPTPTLVPSISPWPTATAYPTQTASPTTESSSIALGPSNNREFDFNSSEVVAGLRGQTRHR